MLVKETIGAAIRKEREAQHLDRAALAEIAGLSERSICRLETGESLSGFTLQCVIDALAVSLVVDVAIP